MNRYCIKRYLHGANLINEKGLAAAGIKVMSELDQ
jgi:hypothetical protein